VSAAPGSEAIRCGRCGRNIGLTLSAAVQEDRAVDVCPLCEGRDFYVRKDFDQKLGVAIVAIGGLISAAFYWLGWDLFTYGTLAATALVDLAIYGRVGTVTVCYRCHTEFRGVYRRDAPAFDLHTADVLEHEHARKTGRA
jgi:hypothetical protein